MLRGKFIPKISNQRSDKNLSGLWFLHIKLLTFRKKVNSKHIAIILRLKEEFFRKFIFFPFHIVFSVLLISDTSQHYSRNL